MFCVASADFVAEGVSRYWCVGGQCFATMSPGHGSRKARASCYTAADLQPIRIRCADPME